MFNNTPQTDPEHLHCPLVVCSCITPPILNLCVRLILSTSDEQSGAFKTATTTTFPGMADLTQTATPDKHGCFPPRGFTLPRGSRLPQVATGNEDKASYEATFLVESGKLYEVFAATAASCATLKAWFAYKIRARAIRDGLAKQNAMLDFQLKLPDWQTVWKLIQEKGAVWTEQYQKEGLNVNPWELQSSCSPISALDLFAQVLIVLACNTTANSDPEETPSSGFRWHQYYYEDEGRFFLLYGFMTHLNTMNSQSLTIYEPSDPNSRKWWMRFCGHRINQAAKSYMKGECKLLIPKEAELTGLETGWDPATMLSKTLESGAYHGNEDHTTTTPATAQQASERDFSSHAILKLEPLTDKLNNQDQAHSAQSRFNLIRENHRHSAEFVKELTEIFAPLEAATTTRWQKIADCKRICSDAANDNVQLYKLRHLMADLSDTQQIHAQQYFTLVNTNNPLASVASENLIMLFTPDEIEAEEVSKMKGIFDEIRKDTSDSGGAATQS